MVANCRNVNGAAPVGFAAICVTSGKYRSTGSDNCTRPAATSCISMTAVNGFVIEPIRYTVLRFANRRVFMSAKPTLRVQTSFSPAITPTVMLPTLSFANSASISESTTRNCRFGTSGVTWAHTRCCPTAKPSTAAQGRYEVKRRSARRVMPLLLHHRYAFAPTAGRTIVVRTARTSSKRPTRAIARVRQIPRRYFKSSTASSIESPGFASPRSRT